MSEQTQAFDLSDDPKHPKYALTHFTVNEFFDFWPKLEKEMDLIPHTWRHWTKEYIQQAVANGAIQVWGIGPPPDAVMVFFTQIGTYPAVKVLSIVWAAGSFDEEMVPLMDATLTSFARQSNCTEIEVRGRHGWEPHLRGIGFKKEATVWTRPVTDVRIN